MKIIGGPKQYFPMRLDLRPQACNFIKKETLAQVFSYEFCEIFKNIFLQNTSGRVLLKIVKRPLAKALLTLGLYILLLFKSFFFPLSLLSMIYCKYVFLGRNNAIPLRIYQLQKVMSELR